MKKSKAMIAVILLMMFFSPVFVNMADAQPVSIYFGVRFIDPKATQDNPHRMPVATQNVSLEDHTLYFNNVNCDLTLVLLDNDGNEAYTAFIPAGTTSVVLPSSLSGDYELQLYPGGSYYFYSDITLS